LVKCNSFPGKEIKVHIEDYEAEELIFSDNYLAFKYEEESIEFFINLTKQVFNEAKIVYEVSSAELSPEMPVDASFIEYLSDGTHDYGADIILNEMDTPSQEQMEHLALLLSDKVPRYSIRIIVVNDEDYAMINSRDDVSKLLYPKKYILYVVVQKPSNGEVSITWNE
jgi:hypothetical protein